MSQNPDGQHPEHHGKHEDAQSTQHGARPGQDATPDESTAATPNQRVLNDRYELSELIGRGGMADVWLARDLLLGRDVAVKILRSDLARDSVFQARFRREAKAVAGLNDRGIVAVYDTGDTDVQLPGEHTSLKVPFIVMEYVKGHTLKSRLSAGPLSLSDAINATLGVLTALAASHAQGIVHRDIKPANVMVTDSGAIKVMDFGIARAMADSAATMTQTQAVVGTAQYLSPEQARGESVDERSDIYSTGCLLYELLTGRPPFVGDSPVAVAYQHVGEAPKPASELNSSVPPAVDAVLERALAKDRTQRFQTAAEFAAALRGAQRGESPTQVQPAADAPTAAMSSVGPATGMLAATASEHQPSHRADETGLQPALLADAHEDAPAKRNHTVVWVVAAVLVVLIAVGAFLGFQWLQAERERNARTAVPAVAGMTQADAEQQLRGLGFTTTAQKVFSDDVDRGKVVETDPASGQQAKKGSSITLRVSQGPEQVKIPDNLKGMSQSDATAALEKLGFTVASQTKQAESDDVEKDAVVRTDPAAGESVKNGSEVTLVVSKGQVQIPQDISGKSEDEVRAQLTDLGLKVAATSKKTSDPELEEGMVVSTDPEPGSKVKVGGSVTLVVSDGKIAIPETTGDGDDLVGAKVDAVKQTLQAMGLQVDTTEKDSPKDKGTVLSVDPKVGTTVQRGDTVKLEVSSGTVKMPDLKGKSFDDANKQLTGDDYGLSVTREDVDDSDEDSGTVVDQNPTPGSTVSPGDQVTLKVAK